jgi:hypothetical protein
MLKGAHYYECWRIDYVQCYAPKETYEQLGLLLFAAVLHNVTHHIVVHLGHPSSEICRFVLDPAALCRDPGGTGLELMAARFEYWPSLPDRHPWLDEPPAPEHLPCFSLTNEAGFTVTEEDRAARDTVVCDGGTSGTVRFAELLLNISRDANDVTEFPLECEAGFRGVGPRSPEVRLWLPGGDGWDDRFTPAATLCLL